MKKYLQKLLSRKFILSLGTTISAILVAFNCDSQVVLQVSGLCTAVLSTVAYVVSEGNLDYLNLYKQIGDDNNGEDK